MKMIKDLCLCFVLSVGVAASCYVALYVAACLATIN